MKLYYDQDVKDHPFRVGYEVSICNPAIKSGVELETATRGVL